MNDPELSNNNNSNITNSGDGKHFSAKYFDSFKRRLSVVDSPKIKKDIIKNEDRASSATSSPILESHDRSHSSLGKKTRERGISSDTIWGKINPKSPKLNKSSRGEIPGVMTETFSEPNEPETRSRTRSHSHWVYGQIKTGEVLPLRPEIEPPTSPKGPFLRSNKTLPELDSKNSSHGSSSSPSSTQNSYQSASSLQEEGDVDQSNELVDKVDIQDLMENVDEPDKLLESLDKLPSITIDEISDLDLCKPESVGTIDKTLERGSTESILLVSETTHPLQPKSASFIQSPSNDSKPKLKPRSQLRSEMVSRDLKITHSTLSSSQSSLHKDVLKGRFISSSSNPNASHNDSEKPSVPVLKHQSSRLRQLPQGQMPIPDYSMIHPSLLDKMKTTLKESKQTSRPDVRGDFFDKSDSKERKKQFRRSKSVPSLIIADVLNQKDGEEEKIVEWRRKGVIYKILPSGTKLIKAGPLDRLVEWMTTSDAVDPNYVLIFLLTYRAFTDPRTLFEMIRQIYWETCSDKNNIQWLEKTRTRIFHVLRKWLLSYIYDLEDENELLHDILAFLETITPDSMNSALLSIFRSVEKNIPNFKKNSNQNEIQGISTEQSQNSYEKPSSLTEDNLLKKNSPQSSLLSSTYNNDTLNKNEPQIQNQNQRTIEMIHMIDISFLNFCMLDDRLLAQQLTLYGHRLYKRIQGQEFIFNLWSKKFSHKKAHNLISSVDHFNIVAAWVASEVLKPNQPLPHHHIIEKWIQIAKFCDEYQNISDVIAILAGLHSTSVWRLRLIHEKISPQLMKVLSQLERVYSYENNFKQIREMLKSKPTPMIPYLGLFTKDILFIEDGNATYHKDNIINFDKFRMMGNIILEIQTYQQGYYPWSINHVFQQFISNVEIIDENTRLKLSYELQAPKIKPNLEESSSSSSLNNNNGDYSPTNDGRSIIYERHLNYQHQQHQRNPSPYSVRSISSNDINSFETNSFVPSSLNSMISSDDSFGTCEHEDDFVL